MNSQELHSLQEAYSSVYEASYTGGAVGKNEMIAANIARAKVSRTPSTAPKPTTPTTTDAPKPTGPAGPVSQAPKPAGGLLGTLNTAARDVAGRVGGEIGAAKGRGTLGNVLGIPEKIGRNRGTQQGQQMYDKAKETIGGLLKQDYEPDLFDVILEYLVTEGYADTNESALVIMANMSEEWRESIVELTQSDL